MRNERAISVIPRRGSVLCALVCALLAASCASTLKPQAPRVVARADCRLTPDEQDLLRRALATWQAVEDELLYAPRAELPWIIFVGKRCTWQLAPPRPPAFAERRSLPGLTWRGHDTPVWVAPHAGTIHLPSGDVVGVQPLANTSVAEDGTTPFFVLALPHVWLEHPAFANEEASAELTSFWFGVLVHELVHTRQIVSVAARIAVLRSQQQLPAELDDDVIQTRFASIPGFAEGIQRELETLHAAATASSSAESRQRTRALLEQAQTRRREHFTGVEQVYGELEELFLSLEGAACWLAWLRQNEEHLRDRARHELLAEYDPTATNWVQGYGLLLYALLDRHLPSWQQRSFGRLPASPFELLSEALQP